jgi:hypothetical protein
MQFLAPSTIAIAAALSIPPLVALYFLKLKRNVRVVPSTLLWKRSVEDLHVNSPFQRLRSSLLLLLQLLVLVAGAIALGRPMFQTAQAQETTNVILIDNSASMAVVEADGRTRLDEAKEQAKRVVDNMSDEAQAMVIAFCDRATVESSFDSDKAALKRKIDSIEQTQSSSTLSEAISLAEAYAQNQVIGGEDLGSDVAPESAAPDASVFLFTDGRVEDTDEVAVEKFDVGRMRVVNVGKRMDNVAIVSMDARRRYEQPEILEVTALVQNFDAEPRNFDAVLYVDGQTVDVQSVSLASGLPSEGAPDAASGRAPVGSIRTVAFDNIEFGGSGTVEVALRIDDALSTDNRAWTIIPPPRRVSVLLVYDANPFFNPLDATLRVLPIELKTMTPDQYEAADDKVLTDGRRSAFDVVVFDQHSTDRLSQGSYLFFGGTPQIDGVTAEGIVDDEVIFNWDETHPVLRHVAVEAVEVFQWRRLRLPPEAVSIVDGASSPVLAYLARGPSQYLIGAFGLIVKDKDGDFRYNTYWVHNADFIVFTYNAIQFLASNIATSGTMVARPGQPVTVPVPADADTVVIRRPDGSTDKVAAPSRQTLQYARTRHVGVYEVSPAVPGHGVFAVNLFNPTESRIEPVPALTLGAGEVSTLAASIQVNKPAWPYILIALLAVLVLEWVVYNQRVFV